MPIDFEGGLDNNEISNDLDDKFGGENERYNFLSEEDITPDDYFFLKLDDT